MKMNQMVTTALLLSIGFVLHTLVPGFFGMKFDLLLTFMFISIVLNPNIKNTVLVGMLSGILTAMTSTFPGGQLPNLIEKPITAFIVFLLITTLKIGHSGAVENIKALLVGFLGTLVSGVVFLSLAFVLVGLPASFSVLFLAVVLPTALTNTLVFLICYKTLRVVLSNFRALS